MKRFLTENDIKEGKEFAEMFGKIDKLGKALRKQVQAIGHRLYKEVGFMLFER